jgi:hypothetical protein
MKNHAKLCGRYQKSVLSAKNNFNLYVTSVLFAAVFIAVSEVELSGRSYVAASSSRIAYNVMQISEGTNSVGFSEGFGLLLMCCYNQCF